MFIVHRIRYAYTQFVHYTIYIHCARGRIMSTDTKFDFETRFTRYLTIII